MSEWSGRITALEDAGWSLAKIADEIGIAYSSLCDIKRGDTKEPRGMAAVRLHDLHSRVCLDKAA